MSPVACGEFNQIGAVEIYTGEVDVVRILIGINPSELKPDLALFVVDAIDFVDDPFAFGDLVFGRAGFAVEEVEVIPAVAFGHPDDFLGFLKPMVVFFSGVADESLRGFGDKRGGLAGFRIDGDDAEDLMSALVVEEGELRGVGIPVEIREAPGILEELVVEGDFFFGAKVEEVRAGVVDGVAGFDVGDGFEFGLRLVFGGGFHDMNLPLVWCFTLDGDDLTAVRRPIDLAGEGIVFGAGFGEGDGFFCLEIGESEIVI